MDDHDEQELRIFDSSLQKRTESITDVTSKSDGALSLESLILVIRCLGDTNQDVVNILLGSKDDINGSPELLDLVKDYFSYSHKTLEFLNILEHWLNGRAGVSWKLRRVKSALSEFKAEKTKIRFGRTRLQLALSDFAKASDDSVARELKDKLTVILDEQERFHERLLDKKHEDDFRRQGRFNVYRKVSAVILASLYMVLLACAVTAALSTMHPQPIIAVAVAIGSMNPIDHVGRLVDYMLSKYEEKLRRRSELLSSLTDAGSGMQVEGLKRVKVAVQGFQEKLQGFSAVGRYKDPELKSMVDDMEKKIDEFSMAIKDLQTKKDKCYKDVTNARRKICGSLGVRDRCGWFTRCECFAS